MRTTRRSVRAAATGLWLRWWEWPTTAALAVLAFRLGFGSFRRLSVMLGGGDLLSAYAVNCLWSAGHPTGSTRYGFPFGMQALRFPSTDVLHSSMAELIGALTNNCFLGTNALLAISFPLTALAGLWVLRLVGLRGPVAVSLALALTTVPYHWLRLPHIFLGTMYTAVLGVGLALMVGSGAVDRVFRPGGRWSARLGLVGVGVVVGLGGIYYTMFAGLLCVVALVYLVAHGASWRSTLRSVIPVVVMGVVVAAALLPAWLVLRHDPSVVPIAQRLPAESVTYAGILAITLLPARGTWLPGGSALDGALQQLYDQAALVPGAGVLWDADAGSVVTSAAAVFALVGAVILARRRSGVQWPAGRPRPGLVLCLLSTVVLFFVPWGLNFLFATYVTAQFRGWDRWVPILLLLLLVLAAQAWSVLWPRRTSRGSWLVAGALVVVVLLDGVLPHRAFYDDAANSGQAMQDAALAYADALNTAIPQDCGVLQLPYIAYPESAPRAQLGVYDPLLQVLTNPHKSWTAGAIRDTMAAGWLEQIDDEVTAADVEPLVAGGFCAVHIDLRGYEQARGDEVVSGLTQLLGQPVASGLAGSWLAFRLPGVPGSGVDKDGVGVLSPELRDFFVPPLVRGTVNLPLYPQSQSGSLAWWTTTPTAELSVTSTSTDAPFRSVSFVVQAPSCSAQSVTVRLVAENDTVQEQVDLAAGASAPVVLRVDQDVRAATIQISTDQAACSDDTGRQVALGVLDPRGRSS